MVVPRPDFSSRPPCPGSPTLGSVGRHHLDPEVAEALLPDVLALGPDPAAADTYAPALDIPAVASPQEQLLAALGRTP